MSTNQVCTAPAGCTTPNRNQASIPAWTLEMIHGNL
jgi:hypothetical protein